MNFSFALISYPQEDLCITYSSTNENPAVIAEHTDEGRGLRDFALTALLYYNTNIR